MKGNKIFFPNLDGLRFLAFLMVFLWHTLKTPFEMLGIQNPWINNLFYCLINGKTGVSIFFVLSGFLITYLILAEIGVNNKLDVFKFYIRRSLRIWPLYFLILVLVFAVVPFTLNMLGISVSNYDMRPWFYFLFLSNFDTLHIFLINGRDLLASTITWSVAIEEQFYLVWPLLFTFIPVTCYKFIFPVILIGSYIFRSFYASSNPVLYFHTLSVCGDLALGGWVAYWSFTKREFVLFFANQTKKFRISVYLAGVFLLYLLQFANSNFFNVYGRLLQTIFFCYVILDQNFSNQHFLQFSNSRLMSFWGKYTYGLYLWHPLVLLATTAIFTRSFHYSLLDISTHLIVAPIVLAGSLLISYGSYHFFELYFLHLKTKFSFISGN